MENGQSGNWIVIKLGGTSVSRAAHWRRVAGEIHAARKQNLRVLVVQSALAGVTNTLDALLETGDAQARRRELTDIAARHRALADEMGIPLPPEIPPLLEQLERDVAVAAQTGDAPPRLRARVLAAGELLASRLGAACLAQLGLGVQWHDARELLQAAALPGQSPAARYLSATCPHAPDPELAASLAAGGVALTQGFIARNAAGDTVLLGRGGSDTSAACLAAMLQAERLEIWTDVPGLFSANPRLVPGARLLHRINYEEAQEIATTGARVLHPRCIEPARRARIPIHIRYTPDPGLPGTCIAAESDDAGGRIKAISVREDITLVSMETLGMWHQVGFLADAFACFKRLGLSVDLVSTSETNVTVSLDPLANTLNRRTLDELLAELGRICQVRLLPGCAAISLVGRQVRANLHRLAPALELFGERRVHLLSQAANDLNFTFVVDTADAARLLRELHALFVQAGEDDPVFGPSWSALQAPAGAERPAGPVWWRERRDALLALAAGHESAYVYDLASVDAAAQRLRGLGNAERILYSMKANPHPEILRTLYAAGLGFECVSPGEIRHLRSVLPELDPGRILFTPNFAPRHEYASARELGVLLTLDNLHPLREWPELFREAELFLRLDPGQGAGHHRHVRTAGEHSKFGIPLCELEEALECAAAAGARVTGLHAHAGSGIFEPEAWEALGTVLGRAAARCPDVRILDLGGGLGVPEKPGQGPLDLARLDAALGTIRERCPGLSLWLEPGRYLVSAAGVLLSRVTQLKGKGRSRYVGIATGMNSLLRPALYGAHHRIVNLTRLDEPADVTCNIVGPICETGDILGHERRLPEPRENDVLLIANAGAYGHAMSSRYNLREPAVELIL